MFLAFLSAFIANLEHAFVYQFSSIDSNTLFPEMEYEFVFKASKQLFFKIKQHWCNVTCHFCCFIPSFQQVFAYIETSYVKASNLHN